MLSLCFILFSAICITMVRSFTKTFKPHGATLSRCTTGDRIVIGLGCDVFLSESGEGSCSTAEVVLQMTQYGDAGLLRFDLTVDRAEGSVMAEEFAQTAVGSFMSGPISSRLLAQSCAFHVGWKPDPGLFTPACLAGGSASRRRASEDVTAMLLRMKRDRHDLVQFQWEQDRNWFYFHAMDQLMGLQQEGFVRSVGLKHYGAAPMLSLLQQEAPIVTNQVSYSMLDTRPAHWLVPAALEHNVTLIASGVLLGGLLSDYWVDRPAPDLQTGPVPTRPRHCAQLQAYLRWVELWGGWALFQALLRALRGVARRHGVSLAAVARRWVLDQPAVRSIVVCATEQVYDGRADASSLLAECQQLRRLRLDEEDRDIIAAVQARSALLRVPPEPADQLEENAATTGEYRELACAITLPSLGFTICDMFGKVKHRILDIIMNKFSEKTFSACIMSNITDFVHKDLKTGVSFHYLTPDNLCRKYSGLRNTKPQFSAGAIMAVFDEISTYSTVMRDKTHRPGLSVHLSTEILKPVYTGEKVTVLTKADKLGKTIGFCSMELLNQQGELVARGKHIRYLQMGMPFDLIAHPVAMPWTVKIYEMFYARKGAPSFSANGKEIFPVPANFPSIDGVGRVFDVLGLQRTPNIAHNEPDSEETDIASSAAGPLSPLYCSDNGRVDPSTVHSFSMTVRPVTSNVLGAMHGGAVACAVEHACLLSRAGNAAPDGSLRGAQGAYDLDCYVQCVEVRYIAAMKGDLVITVVEDVHAPQLPDVSGAVGGAGEGRRWPSKSFGRVLSKDDGTLCAEYVCSWTR